MEEHIYSSTEEEDFDERSSDYDADTLTVEGYSNEPEYSKTELEAMKFSDNESGNSNCSDDEMDSSRLENMHWCSCGECTIILSLVESTCCKESSSLLGDKLDDINCITQNKDFKILCLNPNVLDTSFIHRRYQKNFKQFKSMNNRFDNFVFSYSLDCCF